jgi:hypothetical protein
MPSSVCRGPSSGGLGRGKRKGGEEGLSGSGNAPGAKKSREER